MGVLCAPLCTPLDVVEAFKHLQGVGRVLASGDARGTVHVFDDSSSHRMLEPMELITITAFWLKPF